MTRVEFAPFVLRYSNLWRVDFTDGQTTDWHRVLGGLRLGRLLKVLDALSIDHHRKPEFPPKIAEVVEKYEEIKRHEAQAARAGEVSNQQRLLSAEGQHYCHICRNNGTVAYDGEKHGSPGYGYVCRCSCARGKDLNRWSRHQITKGMTWKNPTTHEDESLYVPDVNDALTPEEIGLIKAKNMSRSAAVTQNMDIGAMVQGIVGSMDMGRACSA